MSQGEADPTQAERLVEIERFQISKKLASIAKILSPLDQTCLTVAFDQEALRDQLYQMKKDWDEKLRTITMKLQMFHVSSVLKIRFITQLEKLAWGFHCRRVVKTVDWFAREIANKLSMDGNEQFSVIIKELERLSSELAQRDVELALARSE